MKIILKSSNVLFNGKNSLFKNVFRLSHIVTCDNLISFLSDRRSFTLSLSPTIYVFLSPFFYLSFYLCLSLSVGLSFSLYFSVILSLSFYHSVSISLSLSTPLSLLSFCFYSSVISLSLSLYLFLPFSLYASFNLFQTKNILNFF